MLAWAKSIYSDKIRGSTTEETLVMLAVISIFLPYVLTAVVVSAVAIRAVLLKDTRKAIFAGIDGKLLVAFALINAATPFVFKNYFGAGCFFGVCIILIFALYLRTVMTERLFERIADAAAFMSMCCAVVARIQRVRPSFRSPSVFFNPNYYGAVIAFMVLLCLYRLIRNHGNRAFLLTAVFINFYGLLQADCQSAFFSIILGACLLVLFTKRYKFFVLVASASVAVICLLPWLDFLFPRIGNAEGNLALRATIWEAGVKGFLETPLFGRGMMGYMQIFEKFAGSPNYHCHNIFIDMLLSFGIIGAIPLVWFVLRSALAERGKKSAPLFFALVAAVLLHGLTDVTIAWIQTGALAAVFMSLPYIKEE